MNTTTSLAYLPAVLRGAIRTATLAMAGGALAIPSARAELILYEGFHYGDAEGEVAGKGTAGGGWGGAWQEGGYTYGGTPSHDTAYQPAGLTFGTLPVTGGNAHIQTAWNGGRNLGRPHTASATGDLYGGYLIRPDSYSGTSYLSLFEGGSENGASGSSHFSVEGTGYAHSLGGVVTHGGYSYCSGDPMLVGETYLVLFHISGLGPEVTEQTITMWMLTEDQFAHHAADGLTEAELNAATPGDAATELMQRAGRTTTSSYQFASGNSLVFGNYYTASAAYDELRISDTALAEVIGEPGPPPPVRARKEDNGEVVISWSQDSAGWLLYESPDLGPPPASWAAVAPPYGTEGQDYTHTIIAPAGQRFFQLRQP